MKGYETCPVKSCGSCAHFRRHYILIETDYYIPINYGHCVVPQSKKRRADEHCPRWAPLKEENAHSCE